MVVPLGEVSNFLNIDIEDPGVVSKSYPEYWDDLRTVGFVVEEK